MKRKVYKYSFIISLIVVIISLLFLINYYKDGVSLKKIINSIDKDSQKIDNKSLDDLVNPPLDKEDSYYTYINEPFLQVDFTKLLNQNKDVVAWIKLDGTLIDYPVVQSKDNSYYLDHSFNKTKNNAGWVFSDFRNNLLALNKNTVIYGHKMTNKTMFGSLVFLLDEQWFNDLTHNLIMLSTPSDNMIFQIFSVYTIHEESYYITTHFKNDEEYQNFLDTILSRSYRDFKTNIHLNDKIITLSTCKDYQGNRIVVHAKLIKKRKR